MVAANVPRPFHLPDPARSLRRLGAAALLAAATALPAQTTAPTAPGAAPAGPSFAFELITAAEARRDHEARPKNEAIDMPELRSRGMPEATAGAEVPAAFAIRVLMPTPQEVVTAPLRIELAFDVPPGTRVRPSTFRVLYGVLKIDLTERLRRFATISERGVVVDQAVVPDDMHRLFLQVADEHGNMAERELRLRVGATS